MITKDLVPIKVKIGLRANGNADHPNWTRISFISSDEQVRQYTPMGWVYDKECGHNEVREDGTEWDSPHGMQWGCMLVTKQFADAAVATFPTIIEIIDEARFESFYNNCSRTRMGEKKYDLELLQGMKMELELEEKVNPTSIRLPNLKSTIAKAIDPDDKEMGVRKNHQRFWEDCKNYYGYTIKQEYRKP